MNAFDKVKKQYSKLPMTEEMLPLFEEYKTKYSYDVDDFKVQYYQTLTDIEFNILEVGQTVYYVFGNGLKKGIIEETKEKQ